MIVEYEYQQLRGELNVVHGTITVTGLILFEAFIRYNKASPQYSIGPVVVVNDFVACLS